MVENISLVAHSAIRIVNQNEKVIYFDPFTIKGKYENDADIIFITHSHYDHFSPEDINDIRKINTKIVATEDLYDKIISLNIKKENILLVEPNKKYEIEGIEFETIPAYNLNKEFHKREYNWVGYLVKIDNKIMYIAGDTDNTKEAQKVKCNIAFVPVGGTYTMTAKEAADLVRIIKPDIAVPIHYKTIVGSVEDATNFKELLKDEVRVEILMN